MNYANLNITYLAFVIIILSYPTQLQCADKDTTLCVHEVAEQTMKKLVSHPKYT